MDRMDYKTIFIKKIIILCIKTTNDNWLDDIFEYDMLKDTTHLNLKKKESSFSDNNLRQISAF